MFHTINGHIWTNSGLILSKRQVNTSKTINFSAQTIGTKAIAVTVLADCPKLPQIAANCGHVITVLANCQADCPKLLQIAVM